MVETNSQWRDMWSLYKRWYGQRGTYLNPEAGAMLSKLCLLAAVALSGAIAQQYIQPPVGRQYTNYQPAVAPYVYTPSASITKIQEAASKQSKYAADKLKADVEAVNNFKLENAAGLDYTYQSPDYNNIAVQFGAQYLDPASYKYQYDPEAQYKYNAEDPQPFVYKYNGPTSFPLPAELQAKLAPVPQYNY